MAELEVSGASARDPDRVCRRRSDVQGKLYNFLNRSAQSLSRSNSQSGRSRRVKDKENELLLPTPDRDRVPPRVSHAAPSSHLIITSGNAPETSLGRLSSSARSSRSTADQPRKSSPPPPTPSLVQHKHTLSSTPQTKASAVVYSYNTPPQTPSRSRKQFNPSSPGAVTSGGRDLLLNRPLARPITPSNSSSGKKVFGIPISSPTPKKGTFLEVEGSPERQSSFHKLRSGSGSSNEPLLCDLSPSDDSGRAERRTSTSTSPVAPRTPPRPYRTSEDHSTPLPTPSSSLPRSQRSAVSSARSSARRGESPPASPTTGAGASKRGTPRLDFWRSLTPRPRTPSNPGDKEKDKDKGKQRAGTSDASRRREEEAEGSTAGLVSPQPRAAPATFLPRFQRTPPTPRRSEEEPNTVRLDSFMSDSLLVQQTVTQALKDEETSSSGLTRQPAFSRINEVPHTPRTPGPERNPEPAPAVGIQRSNSAPGTRGRLSPCLRIPSPKFLTRDRSKERDKEREKEGEKEREKEKEKAMRHEKRKVTPESVGAPMIRETRAHLPVHAHTISHGNVVEKGGGGGGLKAAKTSMVQLRRAAHGTFDFERPGSRTSSNGQSESRGTRSDDEREKEKDKENDLDSRRRIDGRSPRPILEPLPTKLKAPSPVPPLPTSPARLKPLQSSPPVRTRSPLRTNPSPPTINPHAGRSFSPSHAHLDDSALPRLSSSLARRNTAHSGSNQHFRTRAHGYRTPASLPHFSFEPAAPPPSPPAVPPKPTREAGGQYIDTRTGLIMYAPKTKEDASLGRRSAAPKRVGTSGMNGQAQDIPPEQLEEATAVITEFKNALDDAGFATLQKYVRRYDAHIIPLDGSAGLLARIQRLLVTSAPRVNERQKRQLYESFVRLVSQVS